MASATPVNTVTMHSLDPSAQADPSVTHRDISHLCVRRIAYIVQIGSVRVKS